LGSSIVISTGIFLSVQLWAKETEILSGTINGIEIHFWINDKKQTES